MADYFGRALSFNGCFCCRICIFHPAGMTQLIRVCDTPVCLNLVKESESPEVNTTTQLSPWLLFSGLPSIFYHIWCRFLSDRSCIVTCRFYSGHPTVSFSVYLPRVFQLCIFPASFDCCRVCCLFGIVKVSSSIFVVLRSSNCCRVCLTFWGLPTVVEYVCLSDVFHLLSNRGLRLSFWGIPTVVEYVCLSEIFQQLSSMFVFLRSSNSCRVCLSFWGLPTVVEYVCLSEIFQQLSSMFVFLRYSN